MKKYFLLATVAGCVLNANAWAGGGTADDGKSATVNVGANFAVAQSVEWSSDINFGTLLIANSSQYHPSGAIIATVDSEGVVTNADNERVVVLDPNGTAGTVLFSNSVKSASDFTVTCALGGDVVVTDTSCPLNGEAVLEGSSGHLYLKNISVTTNSLGDSGYALITGSLYFETSANAYIKDNAVLDSPAIKVTVNY